MNPVLIAREIAARAHGTQMYGEYPYLYHLEQVEEIVYLATLGNDPNRSGVVIALLHDILEDTDVTSEELLSYGFTECCVKCVELLTDEEAPTRKERKRLTNEKLSKIEGEYELVLIVKAADRLANVRHSERGSKHYNMYKKEHSEFKNAVYREGLCDNIWKELNELMGCVDGS